LAACVNLVSKMESHYYWQGQMEVGNEVMMLIKTSREKVAALEKLILANHPYDTPEFLAVNLSQGNERYLDWLAESLA
jgi:periplasmic divalent cation tolerance protein